MDLWTEYKRTGNPRLRDRLALTLRPHGQVHRLLEGPGNPRPLRGRRLHLLRPRGPHRLDRSLRPGKGRDARALRLDAYPRRRARRAAPQRLGAALPARSTPRSCASCVPSSNPTSSCSSPLSRRSRPRGHTGRLDVVRPSGPRSKRSGTSSLSAEPRPPDPTCAARQTAARPHGFARIASHSCIPWKSRRAPPGFARCAGLRDTRPRPALNG